MTRCKGYSQHEGVYYEETFISISRIEVVRMFFGYACSKKFKVYLMDVELMFMNEELEEEVYIEKSEGFL